MRFILNASCRHWHKRIGKVSLATTLAIRTVHARVSADLSYRWCVLKKKARAFTFCAACRRANCHDVRK
uniref:Putative secreted protein n=1 Tax=Ixodes ricinus TaxID=34613 RepID=A0A6B0TTA9_IXORI